MKPFLIIALLIAMGVEIISCKKDASHLIIGKWSIVTDSSFLADAPPFYNGGTGSVYRGKEGDYYDFKPNGELFIKEGDYSDTLNYITSSDKQVTFIYKTYNTVTDSLGNIISQEHPTKSYTLVALSANHLTMSSNLTANILTPVGYMANILELKK